MDLARKNPAEFLRLVIAVLPKEHKVQTTVSEAEACASILGTGQVEHACTGAVEPCPGRIAIFNGFLNPVKPLAFVLIPGTLYAQLEFPQASIELCL